MDGQTYNSTRVSELQYAAKGNSAGSLPTLKYSYDTYGNILSKTNYYPYVNKSEVYTFTYGDEVWKDLLKKVSYKDLNGQTAASFPGL